jgi:hypothetical protein
MYTAHCRYVGGSVNPGRGVVEMIRGGVIRARPTSGGSGSKYLLILPC